jgi:coenzyme F420-reducing hydrogenase gamma subunit
MKPKIAVHKFSSCDGCQLAFLNQGAGLLALFDQVDVVHFAEAGVLDEDTPVLVSFVEGSISTAADVERIKKVRANSRYLVTIGACATAGGLQALRNLAGGEHWLGAVYATPGYIDALARVSPIREHVAVDFELWGCPVNGDQVMAALRAYLAGVQPQEEPDKVCLECKRRQTVCVMVAHGLPCMGPVTRTGCGALCPGLGRDCYGCFGPAGNAECTTLQRRFTGLGLQPAQVDHRFRSFNAADPVLTGSVSDTEHGDD